MSIITINIKDADPSYSKFGKREGIIYGENTSYYADTDPEVLRFIADKIQQRESKRKRVKEEERLKIAIAAAESRDRELEKRRENAAKGMRLDTSSEPCLLKGSTVAAPKTVVKSVKRGCVGFNHPHFMNGK